MSKPEWFVLGISMAVSGCAGSQPPEPPVVEPVVSGPVAAEAPRAHDPASEPTQSQAVATDGAESAPAAPPRGKRAPCVLGRDQTCNSDPSVSAIWGTCTEGGTCECKPGFELAATGYCQPQH